MEKVSIDQIRVTIEELCRFEDRIAGTKREHEAATYIEERLKKIGFSDINKSTFNVYSWRLQKCTLRITNPVQKEIKAVLFPYSPSINFTSEVVHQIQDENNTSKKHEGKIGLSSWGSALYLSPARAYHQAMNQGLRAVLISAPDDGNLLKIVVVEAGKPLQIPIINISKEDGAFLSELMDKSDVTIEITADVETIDEAESTNLEVVIEGDGSDDLEVIIGAHYDAWFSGAADNAAPAAIVMELARLIKEHLNNGGELRRTVRFLFFGAEESGSTSYYYWLNGSKAYVETNQAVLENAAVMLSLDSIGYPKPSNNYIATSLELQDYVQSLKVSTKNPPKTIFYGPAAYGSDHWFFEIAGVPTIYGVSFPSLYYHTQKDLPEILDYHAVEYHAEFMRTALIDFSNSVQLPYDIFTTLQRFAERLEAYNEIPNNPFETEHVLNLVKECLGMKKNFTKATKAILDAKDAKHIKHLNRFLLSASSKFNKTIDWLWRRPAPQDVDYLARLEYISEYVDLNAAITTLRHMPIANLDEQTMKRYKSQHDNPFNWVNVHEPLKALEAERSRIFKIVEDELNSITKMIDVVRKGIQDIITKSQQLV